MILGLQDSHAAEIDVDQALDKAGIAGAILDIVDVVRCVWPMTGGTNRVVDGLPVRDAGRGRCKCRRNRASDQQQHPAANGTDKQTLTLDTKRKVELGDLYIKRKHDLPDRKST